MYRRRRREYIVCVCFRTEIGIASVCRSGAGRGLASFATYDGLRRQRVRAAGAKVRTYDRACA